ncbi:MAG: hypothetical protein CM15mP79_0310 [Methanobacteriota archaeon]|nr:MAG: hypothetical protein CM15mP79_0310 [Euryarchaeota archaeon]
MMAWLVRYDAFVHDPAREQFAPALRSKTCARPVAFGPRPVDARAPLGHITEPIEHRPHLLNRVGHASRGLDVEGHSASSRRFAIKMRVGTTGPGKKA